jgi:hypothetical protein
MICGIEARMMQGYGLPKTLGLGWGIAVCQFWIYRHKGISQCFHFAVGMS